MKQEKRVEIKSEDIEGNWYCSIATGNKSQEKKVNLYLKNGVCHFGDFQDNRTTYCLKNGILVAKDHAGHVYQAKVIDVRKNILKLKLLSNWQYQFADFDSKNDRVILFQRVKPRNGAVVKQFNFSRMAGYGPSPTYGIQYSSNGTFLFEGLEKVKYIGFYTGKVDKRFWDILVDKIQCLYIPDIKGCVGNLVEDADEIDLEIGTDLGKLSCTFSLSESGNVPQELMDITNYIQSNYDQFKFVSLKEAEFLKDGGTPRKKLAKEILNFIPC